MFSNEWKRKLSSIWIRKVIWTEESECTTYVAEGSLMYFLGCHFFEDSNCKDNIQGN